MLTEESMTYFHEIYESLPRQGPGNRESTERALRMLPPLTAENRILDIGCGTGTQTIDLARATPAHIVAVDRHAPFISQLAKRSADLGLGGQISAQLGDMADLPYPPASFDVIWSEGAIFIVGFARGLTTWRRLLRAEGHLVVSELCWLRENPAAELREFCGPDVGDVAARRDAIAASGYDLIGQFVAPDVAWWENYYVPLSDCLVRFRTAHAAHPNALAVADRSQHEIDLYNRHRGVFGYVFFVMKKIGAD